jgi:uncharacterized protein YutE (UPF0331/DUF86 family)
MVDRLLVERILSNINTNIGELRSADDISWDVYLHDARSRRFVERTLHIIIEGMIDAAHHIIGDEGWREPLSYRDSFVVLSEKDVLRRENLPCYEKIAFFRNLIVHYYERIDNEIIYGIFQRNLGDFELFVQEISLFLQQRG